MPLTKSKKNQIRNQLQGTAIQPKQNNLSLKVFLSSMGFAQNILWYSCGHGFKGNNSLPLKLRSPITSCLLSKRNVLRYGIQSGHIQECLTSANSYRLLNIICPVRHVALSKSYCIFFVLLISMQHGLTVQFKENEKKKRMTIDAFKQYNPLRLAYLDVCSANEIYRDTHPEPPFLSMLCKRVCFRFLIIVVFSP